ncbi:MAG: sialidase family protein [Armatimonadota bacterium]
MHDSCYLSGQSDIFIGRRSRLTRYLVCALQGFFPVLTRTGDNTLAVIFRTGATHIGISGTLAVSTSTDGGKCWSDPVEITPRWEDSRNPAFGVNAHGELIAAFWKASLHNYTEDPAGTGRHYDSNADPERYLTVPATFICRSADNGKTWSTPTPYTSRYLGLASPYGRIISTSDGTLLMPVYGTPREPMEGTRDISILLRSTDGGQKWGDESLVAVGHNETSFAILPSGRMIAAARSESGHIAVLFSDDAGYTWSNPQQVTRDGEHPADLTVLQSGRLQLTFGRRIRPMGCGVLFSDDGGQTWDYDHEVLLAGDGVQNVDLGYPSTVQLADGQLITVLYYATGSEMSNPWGGWGEVSCQAIHYREEDVR